MDDPASRRAQHRISTGVPGLDDVLMGGLLPHSVCIVQGRPGGGKTILANQICFHHVSEGGRALYVTLLAETHQRLLHYIQQLEFFAVERIPEQLSYLSAFPALQEGGLKALSELLRHELRARGATLLVVDGLVAAQQRAESSDDLKKFIQELQIHASLLGHTALLLTSALGYEVRPEHTMADGVLELAENRFDRRSERELQVRKFRGSDFLRGGHALQITSRGITVYPRLEALLSNPAGDDPGSEERVSLGSRSIDGLLHGGLRSASSTVIFGPTGGGKTSLGLHFLSQATRERPGLLFGFYETPPRLLLKAETMGLDLRAKVDEGALAMQWFPPTENILDVLGHRLLAAVRERGAKRVFVDGLDGFINAAVYPERISHFLSALTNALRIHGVTTLYTAELQELFSAEVRLPMQGISSLMENILLVRFLELEGRMLRVFSVVKTRDSGYEQDVRELSFSARGIELGQPVDPALGIQRFTSAAQRSRAVRAFRRLLRKRGRPS